MLDGFGCVFELKDFVLVVVVDFVCGFVFGVLVGLYCFGECSVVLNVGGLMVVVNWFGVVIEDVV